MVLALPTATRHEFGVHVVTVPRDPRGADPLEFQQAILDVVTDHFAADPGALLGRFPTPAMATGIQRLWAVRATLAERRREGRELTARTAEDRAILRGTGPSPQRKAAKRRVAATGARAADLRDEVKRLKAEAGQLGVAVKRLTPLPIDGAAGDAADGPRGASAVSRRPARTHGTA